MRKILFVFLFLIPSVFISKYGISQEINCEVTVMHNRISDVDQGVFRDMETFIKEFINARQWTRDNFAPNERIECSLVLDIERADINSNTYGGSIQIISTRPVFNSSYKTPVLNVKDNEVNFSYLRGMQVDFNPDQYSNSLLSILAYYMYMVLGADYDTFSLEGGTPYYQTAQRIVMSAQGAPDSGWKAFENDKNRYWLVDNILHQTFKPMRKCYYEYHREGLDKMTENAEESRLVIANSLNYLNQVHQIKPVSYNTQVFFLAKNEEVISIFKSATTPEKNDVYSLLTRLDPGNINKYEKIKQGK